MRKYLTNLAERLVEIGSDDEVTRVTGLFLIDLLLSAIIRVSIMGLVMWFFASIFIAPFGWLGLLDYIMEADKSGLLWFVLSIPAYLMIIVWFIALLKEYRDNYRKSS